MTETARKKLDIVQQGIDMHEDLIERDLTVAERLIMHQQMVLKRCTSLEEQ
jgi:hypothetical protein